MKTKYVQIPPMVKVGGVRFDVKQVERCGDNNLGECCSAKGEIQIADLWNKNDKQSEDSKKQTFFHEVVHSILDAMGENELSRNEKFVCCFSGFLNEAMADAVFKVMYDETSEP